MQRSSPGKSETGAWGSALLPVWIGLAALDVYGIAHSFAEHSTLMGVLTLLIPPLGIVMGVEAFTH